MAKPMKKYTYDAFISYRHTELDKYVAETLHRELESFKLPRSVRDKTNGRKKIERVFRDRDELPLAANLEDPIREALEASEYLIVICSPRLRESMWCRKEIETFIELNGREKVFAVLVEGEPEESFPEQLLFREKQFVGDDGVERTIKIPMEPLAADVRGANKREVKKAIKQEVLRLMAPMFGLGYDDLRQRHRERKMKRILAASLSAAAVCLAFGTISTTMALRIHEQNTKIQAQNEEIVAQNNEITSKNQEITEQNVQISAKNEEIQRQNDALALSQALALTEDSAQKLAEGDRVGAVEAAYRALTESAGVTMPYTADAQYALTEALYAYSTGDKYKPVFQLETVGLINDFLTSPEKTRVLCNDNTDTLYLFDTITGEMIQSFYDLKPLSSDKNSYCFLDERRILYLSTDNGVKLYDCETGQFLPTDLPEGATHLLCKGNGRKLWVRSMDAIRIYETENLLQVGQIDKPSGELFLSLRAVNDTDTACMFTATKGKKDYLYLVNWEEERTEKIDLEERYVGDARFMDGCLYVNTNIMDLKENRYQTQVVCYEESDWSEKWAYEDGRSLGRFLRMTDRKVSGYLLFCTGSEAIIIDRKKGQEVWRFAIGTEPVQAFAYRSSELFSVITRNGEMISISPSKKQYFVMDTIFTSCSENLKGADVTAEGFIDLSYSSKKLTCYEQCPGAGLTAYEGELPEQGQDQENLLYQFAQAHAREKGLPDTALVDEIFLAPGEDLGFARYRDHRVVIYRESDGTILNTVWLESSTVNRFFGRDRSGNSYVGGYGNGYILNSSYEKIAQIESFRGLLPEENQVIITLRDENLYTLPILTVEDLLAQGQGVVLK